MRSDAKQKLGVSMYSRHFSTALVRTNAQSDVAQGARKGAPPEQQGDMAHLCPILLLTFSFVE